MSEGFGWFYALDGKRSGPVEIETVRDLLRRGEIAHETLVWHPSLGDDWRQAGAIESLKTDVPSPQPPPLPTVSAPESLQSAPQTVNVGAVRAGIQQAKVGEIGGSIIVAEAFLIACAAGFRAESWAVGIFAFLGIFFLFQAVASSEKTASAFALVMGVAWGCAGYWITGSGGAETSTTWAVAIAAALFGFSIHINGLQNLRDLG